MIRVAEEVFGVPFTAWSRRDGAWGPDTGLGDESAEHTRELLSRSGGSGQCAVTHLDGDRYLVSLPTGGDHTRLAVAVLESRDRPLLVRLAETASRLSDKETLLVEQGRQLQTCLERLAYDMEEQSWLRSLAKQINLCDARTGANQVAAEILPTLQSLIGADGVVFVVAAARQTSDVGTPWSGSRSWAGNEALSPVECEHLIRQFGRKRNQNPVVIQQQDDPARMRALGLMSLVVVRVPKGEGTAGWLLAVKTLTGGSSDHSAHRDGGEFGTVEAGLMESAAVLLSTHARNVEFLHDRQDMVIRLIRTMSSAIDARDAYTRGHSQRVGRYAQGIGQTLEMEEDICEQLYLTGLLHDVGKIGVPDRVLLKSGKLTDEEFQLIKMHPEIGYRILEPIAELRFALPGVLHHHERVDGGGYPHGLSGDTIPMSARVLAVADAFDAMTSSRTYRSAMSIDRAQEILAEGAGDQWDIEVVTAFLHNIESSPEAFGTGDAWEMIRDDDAPLNWQNDSMNFSLSDIQKLASSLPPTVG